MAEYLGSSPGVDSGTLIRLLSDTGHLTGAGRATPTGVRLMANLGLMTLQTLRRRQVSLSLLDRLLDDGYIYCAYYWRGAGERRIGHAFVIYGVEPGTILGMDPGLGQYVRRAESFFASERATLVVLGTSILPGLGRGVGEAVDLLRRSFVANPSGS
jgi:hypothetical protein